MLNSGQNDSKTSLYILSPNFYNLKRVHLGIILIANDYRSSNFFLDKRKKKFIKKNPYLYFFKNWILFREGMDVKLLFRTLLKTNCSVRDTASQTLENLKFLSKIAHF